MRRHCRNGKKRNLPHITAESVKDDFFTCEDILTADKEIFRRNFNTMITALNINLTRMCKHINYDISTVFRIRNGTRNAANLEQFADAVAVFTAKEIKTQSGLMALSKLIDCEDDITDLSVRCEKLKHWLLNEQKSDAGNDNIACFLTKLNDFDLNEYIKAIHFDELKVPTVPFQIPSSKSYFGLKEMMESELDAFLLADTAKPGVRKNIFSSLPLYTASEELLNAVLTANKIPENDRKAIREYAVLKKRRAELILENGFIEDEIAAVSREEFDIRPLSLDISGAFYEKDIFYSYEQYLEHLKFTEEFAAKHRNYKLKKIHSPAFGNLQITIHEQQWAMVSKNKAPAIHFVIKHPKLLNAIENFVPPVVE